MKRLHSLAASWREDAHKRRKMSAHDASADVLDYCASELDAELNDVRYADEEVEVAEYAAMHGRAASTVRRWCQEGIIAARASGRGYRIRRGEPCPDLRASA